jgi:hypothetical protein
LIRHHHHHPHDLAQAEHGEHHFAWNCCISASICLDAAMFSSAAKVAVVFLFALTGAIQLKSDRNDVAVELLQKTGIDAWSWSSIESAGRINFMRSDLPPMHPRIVPEEFLNLTISCLSKGANEALGGATQQVQWGTIIGGLSSFQKTYVERKYPDNLLLGVATLKCPMDTLLIKIWHYLPSAQQAAILQEPGPRQLSVFSQSLSPAYSAAAKKLEEQISLGRVPSRHLDQRGSAAVPTGRVCISITAYEEPAWIHQLLKDTIRKAEPSTMIMLHLHKNVDAATSYNYTEADIKGLGSYPSVRINEERVNVRHLHGGILYAHLSNARALHKQSLGTCEFVVLQASNMVWVRKGMEELVRQRRYGGTRLSQGTCCFDGMDNLHPFEKEIVAPRGLWARGVHEGAFYPMGQFLEFDLAMQGYLARNHQNADDIIDYKCFCEECWLQTYMVNHAPLDDQEDFYSNIGIRVLGPTGASQNHVDLIAAGKDIEVCSQLTGCDEVGDWSHFFAIKRVQRDLNDPVTKHVFLMPR